MKALLRVTFCLCCLNAFSTCLFADNIASDVYPSEEELFEAFLQGDIDYQTYINLIEILEDGIDSTEMHLLEEIPNINYFLRAYAEEYSRLQKEQAESYLVRPEAVEEKRTTGFLRTRTFQDLDAEGRNKNYVHLKSRLDNAWSIDMRFNDNYAGDRECSKRSLIYKTRRGPVRRLILGNFTARFGLGLAIGYRGRLLSGEGEEFEKTLAFPDYGGFNGLYIEGGRRKDALRALLHFDRDADFGFGAGALSFVTRQGNFEWEAIVLGSVLKNRASDAQYNRYQLGTFLEYSGGGFTAAAEMALPNDAPSTVPAVVFETKLKGEQHALKFSGWHYDEGYINLTGGARAGGFFQTITIDTVDFDLRDRRTGQNGLLLNSRIGPADGIIYEFDVSLYGKDVFRNFVRLLASLEIPVDDYSVLGLSFRNFREKNITAVRSENEYRVEYHVRRESLHLRSYLGHTDDKYGKHYISYFTRVRTDVENLGRVELWFNLDKIDYSRGRVDYLYSYIREIVDVTSSLEMAAKMSYRYSRSSSDREQLKFWLEAKLKW